MGFITNVIKYKIRKIKFNREWERKNGHNLTCPGNSFFNIDSVSIGNMTYGTIDVHTGSSMANLKIGNYCSIAENVKFLLEAEHRVDTISTYPFCTNFSMIESESMTKGDIIIEDDVWIGYGVIIMSGVHIGQGAVISAGAVVTKNVPPYAIVGGIPAKIIRYRFSKDLIDRLVNVNFNKLTPEIVKRNMDTFYFEIKNIEQVEGLIDILEKS